MMATLRSYQELQVERIVEEKAKVDALGSDEQEAETGGQFSAAKSALDQAQPAAA